MASGGKFREWVTRLESTPPSSALAATMVPGIGLAAASYVFHLDKVSCNGLELGYVHEINWVWNFAVALPFATLAVFMVVSSARQAIASMVSARMLVERDGSPMSDERITRSWNDMFAKWMGWAAPIALMGFAFSYWECTTLVVLPQTERCGWFTASAPGAHTPHAASRAANVLFGYLAYTMQGVGIAVFVLFLFTVIAFATWIYRFTSGREPGELLPDTTSGDPRLGFQALEPLVLNVLYAGLLFFCVFFLTRIHFLFVVQSTYHFVSDFAAAELLRGFAADAKNLFTPGANTDFFAVGGLDAMSPMISAIALVFVAALSVFIPLFVLRQVAERSNARLAVLLSRSDPSLTIGDRPTIDEQRARLSRMRVWPLEYPKEVTLIAFGVAAACTFFFYRLTFALLAVLVAGSFRTVWRVLRGVDGQGGGTAARGSANPGQGV